MKDIKEVLHLYINSDARYRVIYVDSWEWTVWAKLTEKRYRQLDDRSIEKIEYAVRRLSDMTEDDLRKMINEFSKVDLSDCDYEFELEDDKWINAIEKHGGRRVIAALSVLDGEYISLQTMNDEGDMEPLIPQADGFHYLLKQGFDLFKLIDEGAAIDAKTTTP